MSENPFESPQANPYVSQAAPVDGTTGQFDIGQAVSDGWNAMTANAGVAIGGLLVVGILSILAAITIIGYFLVLPVLAYGMVLLMIKLVDGEGKFEDIFAGFQNYGSTLGSMLLFTVMMVLITLGLSIPGFALIGLAGAMDMPALAMLGQLVNLVITYGIMPRVYFGPFFIVDRGMGAIDALKASWEATTDQKLMSFLLLLVTAIIGFSGVVALGIGLLFTIPLSYVIWASAYRQMVPRS